LAVVEMEQNLFNIEETLQMGLYVALENLQDPGNFGTIIRSADWFGVKAIFCSDDSVNMYNPKVVQASMGAVLRVPVYYTNLNNLLVKNQHLPSYAATLNGNNVYETMLPVNAIVLIGNESKGLSSEIISLCSNQISIPNHGKGESLNAAVACSILLGLWRK
jgi:TrmH family RNA methyltransferase